MHDLGTRQMRSGSRTAYRPHEANACPGCGESQWLVGRVTAECAFCATALPLVPTGTFIAGPTRRRGPATLAA